MMDLSERQWLKHAVTHISDGFEDMRWKKAGSLAAAFIIVGMLFLGEIAYSRLFGMQFYVSQDKLFSVVPFIMRSFVLFAVWTVGNWAVCTLLDGEGTMRNICIYSAYALVPYVAQLWIRVLLSHILIADEMVFMEVIKLIGTGWTVILLFSAVKSVHQYTFGKTAVAICLTLAAMLIMLVLLILFMSLVQQVWIFISAVFTEVTYRVKV